MFLHILRVCIKMKTLLNSSINLLRPCVCVCGVYWCVTWVHGDPTSCHQRSPSSEYNLLVLVTCYTHLFCIRLRSPSYLSPVCSLQSFFWRVVVLMLVLLFWQVLVSVTLLHLIIPWGTKMWLKNLEFSLLFLLKVLYKILQVRCTLIPKQMPSFFH